MNKNFFENMQEQIEPSERLVSSLRTKIAHERAPQSKPANAFMKFMPLTAAACVLIAFCILIFPMVMSGEYVPEAGDDTLGVPSESSDLSAIDFSAPLTPQQIEGLTDEQFLDMFMNGKFITPNDIYIPDDFGVPLDESENAGFVFLTPVLYTVGNNHFAPVDSVETAILRLTNNGTKSYSTVEFIGENDYYFAIHTTDSWIDYKGESMSNSIRWLVPRDSAMAPHESEFSGFSIRMLDKQSVTDILDAWLLCNSHRNLPAWATVLYRSVEETDDSFIYTYYTASRVTYSEDEVFARLVKNRFAICKSTGWYTDDYYDDDNVALKELPFPSDTLLLDPAVEEQNIEAGLMEFPAPDVNFTLPISEEFGVSEWHWEDGGYLGHSGLDFGAPFGTEIYAVADGEVVFADWFSGYGFTVIIEHENGLRTLYAQCSSLNVAEGDIVKQGDTIAFVGATGRADGNHLHFEVRIGEEILNPRHYLFP
jgi:murein DD-endopeptidase MepM/ murein hydrolase activator NlpD